MAFSNETGVNEEEKRRKLVKIIMYGRVDVLGL